MTTGTTYSVTFAELAARLGITVPSAKNLVRRKKWSRHPGNDGLTRITVPVDYLDENASPKTGTDTAINASTDTAIDGGADAGVSAALAIIRQQIERLESENATLKAERDVLALMPVQVAALTATLEAVTAERDRLQMRLDTIMDERASDARRTAEVEQAVTDLRAKLAERAALDARPWWKRLAG